MDKIYVLHALILHDGLSDHQLAAAVNMGEGTCKLIVLTLLEDGIVFKKDQSYLINPMLYRHAIALLKSKNLIH
jgi:DNA-binding IclR family transcriptional regulator